MQQDGIKFGTTIETYGFAIDPMAAILAVNAGYYFNHTVSVPPDKSIKREDVIQGKLIARISKGSLVELYTFDDGLMIVTSMSDRSTTAEDEYEEGLSDGPMPFESTSLSIEAFNPKEEEFKISTIEFYHSTAEANAEFRKNLLSKLQDVEVDTNQVSVTFWYNAKQGPNSYNVNIDVPDWKEIRENYPKKLRADLDKLIECNLNSLNGSLALLHGPAGTGKSFFIRALIEAWKAKCQVNYIIDSDSLFAAGSADYLVQMLCLPKATGKFGLLLLEDSGEMIMKDAKMLLGQAMSRMLNMADGILGQGSRTMMLISTNEEVGSLNDAVVRPGRCFAQLNFPAFPAEEANEWLSKRGVSDRMHQETSLARLYEILGTKQIANNTRIRIGF